MGIRAKENHQAAEENMFNGPEKFADGRDHKLPEKTSTFEYKDSTEKNIGSGEDQKFHYEGNDLPEKM